MWRAILRGTTLSAVVISVLVLGGNARAQVNDPAGRKPLPTELGVGNQGPAIEVGIGSWYGGKLVRGHRTASGERFDEGLLTAAHPRLPFQTRVRVTNLGNGKEVTVKINDRNATYTGRIIDLSLRAAELLDMKRAGIGLVAIVPASEAPALQVISQPARQAAPNS